MLDFEWDERKNEINRQKHGIWFEEAQTVFTDENLRIFVDEFHSDQEERFLAIGHSSSSRILIVIHCFRQRRYKEVVRIISARKATKKERSIYEERI